MFNYFWLLAVCLICRPQKALTSTRLVTCCTKWCMEGLPIPFLWISIPLSPTLQLVSKGKRSVYYSELAYCKCGDDLSVFLTVSVLQSILTTEACKTGMPTVSQLLQTQWVTIDFFSFIVIGKKKKNEYVIFLFFLIFVPSQTIQWCASV